MALMNNWDSMEVNLNTASNSDGSLQKQQDIYAESWEAASKRVKTALQDVYTDLFDDKAFIGLTNGLANVVEGINGIIEGLGGFKGMLELVGSIFLSMYAKKVPEILNNLKQNFMILTNQSGKLMSNINSDMSKELQKVQNDPTFSDKMKTQAEGIARVNAMNQKLVASYKFLTDAERESYKAKIDTVREIYKEIDALMEENEVVNKNINLISDKAKEEANNKVSNIANEYNNTFTTKKELEEQVGIRKYGTETKKQLDEAKEAFNTVENKIKAIGASLKLTDDNWDKLINEGGLTKEGFEQLGAAIQKDIALFSQLNIQFKQKSILNDKQEQQTSIWKKEAELIGEDSKKIAELKERMVNYFEILKSINEQESLGLEEKGINKQITDITGINNSEELKNYLNTFKNQDIFGNLTNEGSLFSSIDKIGARLKIVLKDSTMDALIQGTDESAEIMGEKLLLKLNAGNLSEEIPKQNVKMSTSLTELAGAAMSVHTAFTSLTNIFSVFSDKEATVQEKIGALVSLFMSSTMAFSQASSALTTFSKSSMALGMQEKVFGAISAGANGATASIAATGLALGELLIVIAAVVAAVALFKMAWDNFSANWDAAENNAKKASESLEMVTNNYNEMESNYTSLTDKINNYKDLTTGLDNAIAGTEEYRNKLIELNNSGLDVINTLASMGKNASYSWENGVLKIDESSLKDAQDLQRQKLETLNYTKQNSEVNARVANANSDKISAIREKNGTDSFLAKVNSFVSDIPFLKYLAAIPTGIPGLTAMAVSSYNGNKDKNQERADIGSIEQLQKSYNEIGQAAFDPKKLKKLGFDTTNQKYIDSIKKVVEETANATEQLQTITRSNILPVLEEIDSYKNSKNKDVISSIVAGYTEENRKKIKVKEEKNLTDDDYAEQKLKDYVKEVLNGKNVTEVSISDGVAEFNYSNSEGESKDGKVSLDTIAEHLADTMAKEIDTALVDRIANSIEKIENSNSENKDAILSILNNKNFMSVVGTEAMPENIDNFIASLKGYGITEEDLKTLFNTDNISETFKTLSEDAGTQLNKISENMSKNVLKSYNEIIEEVFNGKLDLEARKKIANTLTAAYERNGEEGVNSFRNILNKSKDIEKFESAFSSLDFDTTTVTVKDFRKALEDAGDTTDYTDSELQKLIDSIRGAGESTESLIKKYKVQKDIADKLSNIGDIIEQDDYDKLDPLLQSYFDIMLDGIYRLNVMAKDYKEAVDNLTYERIDQNIENIKTDIKTKEQLQKEYENEIVENLKEDYQNEYNKEYKSSLQKRQTTNENSLFNFTPNQKSSSVFSFPQKKEKNFMEEIEKEKNIKKFNSEFEKKYYDNDKKVEEINKQLDLWASTVSDSETLGKINGLRKKVEDKKLTSDDLNTISNNAKTSLDEIENFDVEKANNAIFGDELLKARNYSSVGELTKNYNYKDENGKIDENKLSAYNQAAIEIDKITDIEGLDENEIKDYGEYLRVAASNSKDLANNMSEATSEVVAKSIMKMNNGVEELGKNFYNASKKTEGWYNTLKKAKKGSKEYQEAIKGTRGALAQLLDINEDAISSNFIADKDNLELMKKAAEGSGDAIDSLKSNLADDIIANIKVENNISETNTEFTTAYENFKKLSKDLTAGSTEVDIDVKKAIDALDELAQAGNFTSTQILNIADAMSIEPEYEMVDLELPEEIPVIRKHHTVIPDEENGYLPNGQLANWVEEETSSVEGTTKTSSNFPIVALAANGKVPKIKGGKVKAKGNMANTVTSTPKSSGNNGSKYTPKKPKKESVFDPFRDIKLRIEEIDRALNKLDKKRKTVFGKELMNVIDKENKLLAKQRDEYIKYAKEKIEYAKRFNLEEVKSYANKGTVIKTDNETGEILNYREIVQPLQDIYNKAYEEYRKNPTEKNEQRLENAKQNMESLKTAMEAYDSTIKDAKDNLDKAEDEEIQRLDNLFEKYELKIQLKVDTKEAELNLIEWTKKIQKNIKLASKGQEILGNITAALNSNKALNSTIESNKSELEILNKIVNDPNSKKSKKLMEERGFQSISQVYSKIYDINSALLEDYNTMYENFENSYTDYLSAIDEFISSWNEVYDAFDRIDQTIDHLNKVVELLYGKTTLSSLEKISKLYDSSIKNNQEKIKKTLIEKGQITELLKQAQETGDENAIKKYQSELNNINSKLQTDVEKMITYFGEEFTNNLEIAAEKFVESLYGASLEKVEEDWNSALSQDEGYYDDVEEIYKKTSLINKLNKISNKLGSDKNKIIQQEIKMLKEKQDLSEKDVEIEEKKIALIEAQIALEDAKNRKDSMKLVRNEQGNWSYQYVADQDKVDEAQETLLNASNDYRNTSKKAMQETILEMFNETKNYVENNKKLQEERRQAVNDYGADSEEVKKIDKQILEERENYQTKMLKLSASYNGYNKEFNKSTTFELFGLPQEMLTEDELKLKDKTGNPTSMLSIILGEPSEEMEEKNSEFYKEYNNKIIPFFGTLSKTFADNILNNPNNLSSILDDFYSESNDALETYQERISKFFVETDIDILNFNDYIDDVDDSIKDVANNAQEFIDSGLDKKIKDMSELVEKLAEAWDGVKESAEQAAKAMKKAKVAIAENDNENDDDDDGKSKKNKNNKSKKNKKTTSTTKATGDLQYNKINTSSSSSSSNSSSSSSSGTTTTTGSSATSLELNGVKEKETDYLEINGYKYPTNEWTLYGLNKDKLAKYEGMTYREGGLKVRFKDPGTGRLSGVYIFDDYEKANQFVEEQKSKFQLKDDANIITNYKVDKSNDKIIHLKKRYRSKENGGKEAAFESGGYTGDWNSSEGKMAILHEKELVLNKIDTENILSAVQILRDFSNLNSTITKYKNQISSIPSSTNKNSATGNVFNINAEFPNANNANEIREAILSLPNLASQYLSQKS